MVMEIEPEPGVSVVVIGRNEGARLERCLQSVQAMADPGCGVEVIYVDSGSRDASVERARTMGARVIELHPVRPTAALARNAGWRQARVPFVLFLDGDTILDPEFTLRALPEFHDERVAIVWGHRREMNPRASLFNRALDLDWISPTGEAEFCGGDALVRRSALEQVNGYDEQLIAGEEPEMCRRMRGKDFRILHLDLPMTQHDLAITTWAQYCRRARRTGYAYAEVSARFRGSAMPFWENEARANRHRALALTAIPAVAIACSFAMHAWLPAAIASVFFALLVSRTAWKMRWKSDGLVTSLLYGLHSHVQQIPIFLGQLEFLRHSKAGLKRGLIEYKQVPR